VHCRKLCNAASHSDFAGDPRAGHPDRRLGYPKKISFPDFDAVVAQNSMGGRGMEIKIREGETVHEFLTLQGDGIVGPCREGDVRPVGAFELRGLEGL
jgi:hypothetical protein